MIETRVLTTDDWAHWRELRLLALTEAGYAFGSQLADWQGDGDREDRWRARLEVPGSYNVMVFDDGRAVGMAGGMPAGDGTVIELISMYVSPAGRGRGVGDLLMRAVEDWARGVGAATLRLSVVEGNTNARALYERSGFRATGELGDLMPDGVRREHVMDKSLRAVRLRVRLWARPGADEALNAYENAVLDLLPDHGGRLLERITGTGGPTEIQLIEFGDQAGYDGFLADERRLALAGQRDAAVARTEVDRVDERR